MDQHNPTNTSLGASARELGRTAATLMTGVW